MFNATSSTQNTHNPLLKRLVTLILLLNLLVVGIVCLTVQNSKTHYENQAKITTRNISRILDENISGVFEKVHIALHAVSDEAEHQLALGTIQKGTLDSFITRQHSRLPELISFRATNAAGDAMYGAQVKAVTTTSLAQRDYFAYLRDNPNADMVISKPILGGITGKWMVILARRINQPNGTFAGLVYAGIGLDDLSHGFAELNIGKQGVIALLDADLSLIARYPEPTSAGVKIGQKIGSSQLLALIKSGKTAETYKTTSSVDGIERVFSYRRLSNKQSFYIVTGLAPLDYLAGWRREALQISVGWAFFCIVTVVFTTLFYRGWNRTREAELATIKSEQRFRSYVENANDLIYTLSPAGIITYIAPNVKLLLGYLPCELIGTSLGLLIHHEDLSAYQTFLQQIQDDGIKLNGLEYRIQHKNGDWLWLMSNALFVTDATTGESSLFGVGRNINDRKHMEEALLETASLLKVQKLDLMHANEYLEQRVQERAVELLDGNVRFNQLAEQSGTVVWEIDADGLITYISYVSEAVFGYRPDELIGKMHLYDMHPDAMQETFKKVVSSVIKRNEPIHNIEHTIQAKDGYIIWASTSGLPMRNSDGILLGYRGSSTDITESKNLKEQLIQSQKMETVGQLAGGLAHDFNNVLSIINGYSSLIAMELEHNDIIMDYIGKVLAASGRAAELTHSLLAFSRKQVMNPQNKDLNSVVTNVATFVKRIIGENIHCEINITATSLPVYADSGQIEQALINLCTNARDAMPEGGNLVITTALICIDELFISTRNLGKSGRFAVITVSDNGKGMDEGTRKKVFEPFFTTKDVGKGTGLGLAMVYGIIKQHNGFVSADSEPGKGACFEIYLPIVESETLVPDLNNNYVPIIEVSTGTEYILIVEDDAGVREFMYKALEIQGYQVIAAIDGQDGVDKFRENADKISLIIMDLVMPNKGGKEAYKEMLQIKPGIVVLFISGHYVDIIGQHGDLGEHAEIILKPVQPAAIIKKVREMLDR